MGAKKIIIIMNKSKERWRNVKRGKEMKRHKVKIKDKENKKKQEEGKER